MDFVRRQVAAIITTGGTLPALTAKKTTAEIPIAFTVGDDPVRLGLVDSLSHPGGNMTGFNLYTTELTAKRLELLHEMAPQADTVALLVGATSDTTTRLAKQNVGQVADALGLKLLAFEVGSITEFEAASAAAVLQGAGALLLGAEPFFTGQRAQIVALSARYGLPTMYPWREFI
jgi:putative ABC transport system substrate-binding protein